MGVGPRRVTTPIGSGSGVPGNVLVNYGMIRVMQSCFLASIRMSCTSQPCSIDSLRPTRGAAMGGSKSLGEMECTQLMASGLRNVIV